MGTNWKDSRNRFENAYLFTGVQLPFSFFLMINLAVFDYTILYEEVVFCRETWDASTSTHPFLQFSDHKF